MAARTTRSKTLLLFDVDGTLTAPRLTVTEEMEKFLYNSVKTNATVGVVGGSDIKKIAEQMKGMDVVKKFDYFFSENGLVAYKDGQQIAEQSILKKFGDKVLQKLINFSLKYMSELELPAKRGTFVEFRTGLINLCPVGRSCSYEERLEFAKFDVENNVRIKFKEALEKEFGELGLQFAMGGQISIDVFPRGWDKTYCLQFVENDGYEEIHFFGDKTSKGGNDYEIFEDKRTIGHTVTGPEDTMNQIKEVLGLWIVSLCP